MGRPSRSRDREIPAGRNNGRSNKPHLCRRMNASGYQRARKDITDGRRRSYRQDAHPAPGFSGDVSATTRVTKTIRPGRPVAPIPGKVISREIVSPRPAIKRIARRTQRTANYALVVNSWPDESSGDTQRPDPVAQRCLNVPLHGRNVAVYLLGQKIN